MNRMFLKLPLFFCFLFFLFPLQLALGHGARRLHVSAAYRATASVAMSRFEPASSVNYDKIQSNVNIVKKRSPSYSPELY